MKLIETLVPADFRSSITGPLRRFYIGTFVSCMGSGLTYSLFVIYLHNVRGFSTDFATLLLSAAAIVGICSSPVWGTFTDLFGPVRIIMIAVVADAGSLILWAHAHSKTQAAVAALLLALFGGAGWGPSSTLLSRIVPAAHRQRAFGFNFMLVNLGIGFGLLVSASIVNLHDPVSFVLLYTFNAGVTLAGGLIVLTLYRYGGVIRELREDVKLREEGWREVLGDRRLRQYVLAAVVLMIGGYGSQEAGYSLFVVNNLKLPVHVIGIIFFFNTTTIVCSQLWILNRIEGRSRTKVMAGVAAIWFVFWVILDSALALPEVLAIVSLCVAMIVFAIGETMLSPVGPALVNDIAPEHLRGRYNAAAGLAWGLSGTLAPAITAFYFNRHLGNWWPFGTGLTALVGGALMLRLRRHLSASEDGRELPSPTHATR
ncbi:MAG: MFS transporter [Acidimicrobiales bacterium]